MLETEIKQAFDGNLEMILENTKWVNRILERTTWVRLYYLLKIAENFVKGQYESNRIVFYDFFAVPQFQKTRQIARFKGHYGSSMDGMVHSVQMDNLVHKDNMGWNRSTLVHHRFCLED